MCCFALFKLWENRFYTSLTLAFPKSLNKSLNKKSASNHQQKKNHHDILNKKKKIIAALSIEGLSIFILTGSNWGYNFTVKYE